MAFRKLTTDPFTKIMDKGTMSVSMNSRVSHIITPMRNTDIKRCVEIGDWSELLVKAQIQTRRFRREFYKNGV
jgi:hypothetical protein